MTRGTKCMMDGGAGSAAPPKNRFFTICKSSIDITGRPRTKDIGSWSLVPGPPARGQRAMPKTTKKGMGATPRADLRGQSAYSYLRLQPE